MHTRGVATTLSGMEHGLKTMPHSSVHGGGGCSFMSCLVTQHCACCIFAQSCGTVNRVTILTDKFGNPKVTWLTSTHTHKQQRQAPGLHSVWHITHAGSPNAFLLQQRQGLGTVLCRPTCSPARQGVTLSTCVCAGYGADMCVHAGRNSRGLANSSVCVCVCVCVRASARGLRMWSSWRWTRWATRCCWTTRRSGAGRSRWGARQGVRSHRHCTQHTAPTGAQPDAASMMVRRRAAARFAVEGGCVGGMLRVGSSCLGVTSSARVGPQALQGSAVPIFRAGLLAAA